MDKQSNQFIKAEYDNEGDILTFSFTKSPQVAIAEEASDEIWVRFDPKTNNVITIDILNFSSRLTSAFGPSMKYTERTDPDLLSQLICYDLCTKNISDRENVEAIWDTNWRA